MDDTDPQQPHAAIRGLKTVCRCNNIHYRTIERAIRDGARTLHQVATRTTATTGHCGGSCTPDVQEMIAEHGQPAPDPRPTAPENAWWIRKP